MHTHVQPQIYCFYYACKCEFLHAYTNCTSVLHDYCKFLNYSVLFFNKTLLVKMDAVYVFTFSRFIQPHTHSGFSKTFGLN